MCFFTLTKRTNDINNIINELIEEVKEIGNITYSDLANILSEKFSKADNKTLDKVFEAFEKNNIEILDSEENNEENENYEFNEAQKQLLKTIEDEPTALEQVDYELKDNDTQLPKWEELNEFTNNILENIKKQIGYTPKQLK